MRSLRLQVAADLRRREVILFARLATRPPSHSSTQSFAALAMDITGPRASTTPFKRRSACPPSESVIQITLIWITLLSDGEPYLGTSRRTCLAGLSDRRARTPTPPRSSDGAGSGGEHPGV